jgi:hypothetical protein
MVLKFVTKEGTKVYGPPYTKQEEAEFYSRNTNGPVTVARGADDRKAAKSQSQRSCHQNRAVLEAVLDVIWYSFGSHFGCRHYRVRCAAAVTIS